MSKRPRGTGSVYRQKNSRFWWIRYSNNGRPVRESSGFTLKRRAEKLLLEKLAQVAAGTFVSPKDRRAEVRELVSDLIGWYRTVRNKPVFADDTQSRWALHLEPFFGNMRAEHLGTDQVRTYRALRAEQKASPVTVNRELQVLRKAYRLAADSTPPKVRMVPRFEMARENNARKVFMDTRTVDALKQAASHEGLWARCFVEMIFTLGWRKGEVINLTAGNIHLAENIVRIEDTKNGEPREAPLTQNLRLLLEPLVSCRTRDERLFPVKDPRYMWRRICKASGIKAGRTDGYIIHDSRRTTARTKRAAGVDQSVTMALMGWKGETMFRRYGIVNTADKLVALQLSEEWERKQTAPLMHRNGIGAPIVRQSEPTEREN